MQDTPHNQDNTLESWRAFGLRFQAVDTLVSCGRLPQAFEPGDLETLLEDGRLADSWSGILRFLLHLWNARRYHFNLGEIRRWDRHHEPVFIAWATGEATGRPCQYF